MEDEIKIETFDNGTESVDSIKYLTAKTLLVKFQEYQLQYDVPNWNCAHNAAANSFLERLINNNL